MIKKIICYSLLLYILPFYSFSQDYVLKKHGESELCGSLTEFMQQKSKSISFINGFTQPYVIDNNENFSFHIETGFSNVMNIVIN